MLTTRDAVTLRFVLMAREHAQAVGRRMKARREELGLTQREVADRMPPPTDGNYISRWERGEHKPSDDTLDLLAAALETTTAALLADHPDKSATPDLSMNGNAPTQLDRIEAEVAASRVELATLGTQLEEMQRILARIERSAASETRSRRAR